MKKIKKVSILSIIGISLLGSVVFSEPGSNLDPLASMSYVDKKIDDLRAYLDRALSQGQVGETNQESRDLEVVNLSKGQVIVGGAGTEIILRSGSATALGTDLGGLSDLTGAKDIGHGGKIEANHLLLMPRNDGRGVKAETDAIFLVRGIYQVK